jgi:hypothetical protein
MEVSGQPHALAALLPGKEPTVPIELNAGWDSRVGFDAVEKRKFSFPCRESNPNSPAVRPILVTMPTEVTFILN